MSSFRSNIIISLALFSVALFVLKPGIASAQVQPGITSDGQGGIVMTQAAATSLVTNAAIKTELASRPDLLMQLAIGAEVSRVSPGSAGAVDRVFHQLREDGSIPSASDPNHNYTPAELYRGTKAALQTHRSQAIVGLLPDVLVKTIDAIDAFILDPTIERNVPLTATDLLADFGSELGRAFQEGAKGKELSGSLVDLLANSDDPDVRGYYSRFLKGELGPAFEGGNIHDLLSRNPSLLQDPVIGPIAQSILDGQTEIGLSQQALAEMFDTQMTGIRDQIDDIATTLGENADAIQNIHTLLSDSNARQAAEAQHLAAQRSYEQSIRASQSGVYLLSAFAQIAGDTKLAREISVVGNAGIQIADAVNSFSKSGLWSAGGAIATGNIVGAVFSVVGLFGDGAPPPEQMILDEIGRLREEVHEFRLEMHDRFDRVDAALIQIYETLGDRFDQIDIQLGRVNGSLGDIKGALYDIQGEIHRFERKTFAYLDAFSLRPLVQTMSGSLAYESLFGISMTYSQYLAAENTFYTWANFNAADDASSPLTGRSFADSDLLTELTATPIEKNLNYINEFLATRLGQPRLTSGRVANPRDWALAANSYHRLMLENPHHARRVSPTRLDGIIARGDTLATYLDRISRNGNGSPNIGLWNALSNYYAGNLNSLQTAYEARLDDYPLSAGLVAGYDPFVDLYANRVVLEREMAPGADTTKLPFGSVECLAVSPTPNGLPIYMIQGHSIKKLDENFVLTHVAGGVDPGYADGEAATALFNRPMALAAAGDGNLYVSDTGNHVIRKIAPGGEVSTLAGSPGLQGGENGPGVSARFRRPWGIAIGSDSALYVCDVWNHSVRRVDPQTREVSTFVGYNGTVQKGGAVEGSGHAARFFGPHGICLAPDGNFYVTDTWNHTVRKVTQGGVVSTLCGWPQAGGRADGQGHWARFYFPRDISATADMVYVAEQGGDILRKINTLTATVESPLNIADPAHSGGLGSGHICLLRANGSVWVQGSSYIGIANNGPQPPAALTGVIDISSDNNACLALRTNGTIRHWGWTGFSSNLQSISEPSGIGGIVDIACGDRHGLALRFDGNPVTWGTIPFGGDLFSSPVYQAASIPAGVSDIVQVSANSGLSLALKRDGTITAFGSIISDGFTSVPAWAPSYTSIVNISAGASFGAAVSSSGHIGTWGSSGFPIALYDRVISVSSGYGHVVALRDDGTVVAYGANGHGQCNVPQNLTNVVAVRAGGSSSMAIRADGSVAVWGWANVPLGAGSLPAEFTTVPVPTSPIGAEMIENAVFSGSSRFAAGPDGSIYVSDTPGFRVAYTSPENRKSAYNYLIQGFQQEGPLAASGRLLTGGKSLLQQVAILGRERELLNGDDIQLLLFGGSALMDSDQAVALLSDERDSLSWWPPKPPFNPLSFAQNRLSLLENAVMNRLSSTEAQGESAHLNVVHSTLDRLRLAREGIKSPIPLPALKVLKRNDNTLFLSVNGLPFANYKLESSGKLGNWSPNPSSQRDGATMNIPNGTSQFFRGRVQEP